MFFCTLWKFFKNKSFREHVATTASASFKQCQWKYAGIRLEFFVGWEKLSLRILHEYDHVPS